MVMLQETGIDSQFVGLAAFRQAHKFRFNKSDLFFVVVLKPLNREINQQMEELEACDWIHVDDYLNQVSRIYKQIFFHVSKMLV